MSQDPLLTNDELAAQIQYKNNLNLPLVAQNKNRWTRAVYGVPAVPTEPDVMPQLPAVPTDPVVIAPLTPAQRLTRTIQELNVGKGRKRKSTKKARKPRRRASKKTRSRR